MPVFDAQEAARKAVRDHEAFEFIGLDGANYTIPHPLSLTEAQFRRVKNGEFDDVLKGIAPEAWDAIQEMPIAVSAQLADQWIKTAGERGKPQPESSDTPDDETPLPLTLP